MIKGPEPLLEIAVHIRTEVALHGREGESDEDGTGIDDKKMSVMSVLCELLV